MKAGLLILTGKAVTWNKADVTSKDLKKSLYPYIGKNNF